MDMAYPVGNAAYPIDPYFVDIGEADGDEEGMGRNPKKRDSLYAAQGGRMDMEGNRPRKTYKKGRRPGDPNGPSYVRDKW